MQQTKNFFDEIRSFFLSPLFLITLGVVSSIAIYYLFFAATIKPSRATPLASGETYLAAKLTNGIFLTNKEVAVFSNCARQQLPEILQGIKLTEAELEKIMFFVLDYSATRDKAAFLNLDTIEKITQVYSFFLDNCKEALEIFSYENFSIFSPAAVIKKPTVKLKGRLMSAHFTIMNPDDKEDTNRRFADFNLKMVSLARSLKDAEKLPDEYSWAPCSFYHCNSVKNVPNLILKEIELKFKMVSSKFNWIFNKEFAILIPKTAIVSQQLKASEDTYRVEIFFIDEIVNDATFSAWQDFLRISKLQKDLSYSGNILAYIFSYENNIQFYAS